VSARPFAIADHDAVFNNCDTVLNNVTRTHETTHSLYKNFSPFINIYYTNIERSRPCTFIRVSRVSLYMMRARARPTRGFYRVIGNCLLKSCNNNLLGTVRRSIASRRSSTTTTATSRLGRRSFFRSRSAVLSIRSKLQNRK